MNLTKLLDQAESQPYHFPSQAFELLYQHGYLRLPRFRDNLGSKKDLDETSIILEDLIAIGSSDLAVGRIYEGHINALLIIDQFGTQAQKEKYFKEAEEGKIFGIWNTESPSEAMTFEKHTNGYQLNGAKTFCSGGLALSRPIITAHDEHGKQMFILELENHKELEEDKSLWQVAGMESTVSHRIDFSGITVSDNQLIGGINDYDSEPMISTGAIRFAAVQYGGAKALADIAIDHLKQYNRAAHPMQNARIATLGILSTTGQLWFDGYKEVDKRNDEAHINYVNMARTDILRICEAVLTISEKAIGVQGFLKSHPYEQKYRNLKVYLKQPNPDLALEKIGKYFNKQGHV